MENNAIKLIPVLTHVSSYSSYSTKKWSPPTVIQPEHGWELVIYPRQNQILIHKKLPYFTVCSVLICCRLNEKVTVKSLPGAPRTRLKCAAGFLCLSTAPLKVKVWLSEQNFSCQLMVISPPLSHTSFALSDGCRGVSAGVFTGGTDNLRVWGAIKMQIWDENWLSGKYCRGSAALGYI